MTAETPFPVSISIDVDGEHLSPTAVRTILTLACASDATAAIAIDILNERATHAPRGYTTEHDDSHGARGLAVVARSYLTRAVRGYADGLGGVDLTHRRDDLLKAASVVLAALEACDRQAAAALAGGEA